MNVLVTGGGGFIGQAVIEELIKQGHNVASLDLHPRPSPDYESIQGNICDSTAVHQAMIGKDRVIHLAGVLGTHELFDSPYLAVETNIRGSLHVLDACAKLDAGYIGITMPQVFPSIYTATKVASTKLATAYHHNYGFPVVHIRAYNAFGPGQHHGPGHPQKIVPTFAVQAWRREPLPVWGDGQQGVDLIHTHDLARLFASSVKLDKQATDVTIDGGTGKAFTVNEVARLVSEYAGTDPVIHYKPMRRGEIPTDIVATRENWHLLDGFLPQFRYQDLKDTVEWYRDHPEVKK